MPPKGWRKNAEGQYPHGNKDTDLVSIEELLFPRSTVQRLARTVIKTNDEKGLLMAKDSLLALQRSATVFVSYLLHYARESSKDQDRKNINAQDIITALEKTEFSGFVPEVKHKLSIYENIMNAKRNTKVEGKDAKEGQVKKEEDEEEEENGGQDDEADEADEDDENEELDTGYSKRVKDNKEHMISTTRSTDLQRDEALIEQKQKMKDTKFFNDVREEEDAEDEEEIYDEEPENKSYNPITILEKEEEELAGSEVPEVKQNSDEDIDQEDE